MRRYVTRKTLYFRRILIIMIICAAAICVSAHIMLRQYADIVCKSSCSQYGEQLINEAVTDTLSSFDFDSIVSIKGISDCYSGYTVDSEQVNEISAYLMQCINDKLTDELHSYVSVPVGAFTGISFLSGSGPKVKIDIYSVGSPEIRITQRFESAGINQTLFELYAEVSVSFSAVLPSKSVSVTVSRQVLLAQEVIIGDVPQLYYPQNE